MKSNNATVNAMLESARLNRPMNISGRIETGSKVEAIKAATVLSRIGYETVIVGSAVRYHRRGF